MIKYLIDFFNNEYKNTVRLFINKPYVFNPVETVDNSIHRCLRVAHFMQINSKNIDYNEIKGHYNEIKEKTRKSIDKCPMIWYNNYSKGGEKQKCRSTMKS